MTLRLLLISVVSAVLVACGMVYIEDPDCPLEETNKYMLLHEMVMTEFLDAEQDIGRANDLADLLGAMERLETSLGLFQQASPPVCLEEVHTSMADGMSAEIKSFQAAFDGDLELAEEWASIAERAFAQHDRAIDAYNRRVRR